MEKENYTEPEQKEIMERVTKASEYLKENDLTPAAIIQKIRIGNNDTFVDQVLPYLADTRYSPKKPVKIDPKDLK